MPCPSFHYPVLLCRWYAQIDPIKKTVHTCRIYRFLGLVCPVNSHFIGILSKFTHVHFRGRYSQSLCFLNYRTIVASLFYECFYRSTCLIIISLCMRLNTWQYIYIIIEHLTTTTDATGKRTQKTFLTIGPLLWQFKYSPIYVMICMGSVRMKICRKPTSAVGNVVSMFNVLNEKLTCGMT